MQVPGSCLGFKSIPPVIDPSPITAMTLLSSPFKSRATAIPKAAEIDVLECPVPKASCSLSLRLGNPDMP